MTYYTLLLLFFINLLNYLDRYLVSGALSFIQKDLKLSDGQAGALMTAFMLVYMVASPLFGWMGDRYTRKYLIAGGILLWSFAATSAHWTVNYLYLMVCRALSGIGESSYATTAPTVIADIVPIESRGKALAFFYLAIPVGSAFGFMLGGWISVHYAWRDAFLVVGIPGVLLTLAILFVREPQRGQSDGMSVRRSLKWSEMLVKLWHNPSFVLITFGMALMTFAMGGLAHWMPLFLNRCHGIPQDTASFRFGALTVVAGLLGTFVGGWLGDWLQKRHRGAYFMICGVSMLVATPFAIILFTTSNLSLMWSAVFLAEFCLFLNTGPGNTIIANVIAPNMRATAFAVNTFAIHCLGDAISPAVIGAISDAMARRGVDTVCSLTYSMYIMPVMMVISGIIFLLGVSRLAKDTDQAQQ